MPSLSEIEEQGLNLNSTHEELFEWVIGSNRTKLHQKPLGEVSVPFTSQASCTNQ